MNSDRRVPMHFARLPKLRDRIGLCAKPQITGLVVALAVLQLIWLAGEAASATSADLKALWMAGVAWQSGNTNEIYSDAVLPFLMTPPLEWYEYPVSRKQYEILFPYLYPPIWATIVGELTLVTTFDAFATGIRAANLALLAIIGWLAGRLVARNRTRTGLLMFSAATVLVLANSVGPRVAVETGQLQLLVSALLLWAAERDRAGASRAAGAILGFAAAIKAFPAIFIVIWLLRWDLRALLWFAVTGGALGALSLAVAGWPLHVDFLRLLVSVSSSAIVIPLMHGLDPVLAVLGGTNGLVTVLMPPGATVETATGIWDAGEKDALSIWFGRVLLLVALVGLAVWGRSAKSAGREAPVLLWPLAFGVAAFLGPMSWAYQFTPALAVLLVLPSLIGPVRGFAAVALVILLSHPSVVLLALQKFPGQPVAMFLGTTAMFAMLVIYAVATRPRCHIPHDCTAVS